MNSDANACSAWRHVFGSDSLFSKILYSTSVKSKTIFNTCATILEGLNQIWWLCTEKFPEEMGKSVIFPYARDKRDTDQSTP